MDTSRANDPSPRHALLYDEECGLCRATLRAVLAIDVGSRIEAIGLRTEQAARLASDETLEERLQAFHLVTPDGRRWKGAQALLPLFRLLPPLRPLAALLRRSSLAARGASAMYRWVSGHRGAIADVLPRSWTRPLGRYDGAPGDPGRGPTWEGR